MTVYEMFLMVFFISALSGGIGSLTGLGGGMLVIPLLCFLKFDLHQAMGTGLAIGVTNSLVGTALFKRDSLTYIKLGMFLETGIAIGAIIGALTVAYVPIKILTLLFGLVLVAITFFSFQKFKVSNSAEPDFNHVNYSKSRLSCSWFLMSIAGALSGLLGIGSGTLKVLAMDMVLKLPYKVSTSTSTFMIGMTTATTLGVYMSHGYIKLPLIAPAILGTALGGYIGAVMLVKGNSDKIKILFHCVILGVAIEMLKEGFSK